MAQYGGEQYGHKEGHNTDEHAHNPLQSTAVGHDNIDATKINTIGTGAAHGHAHEQGKHNDAGAGGVLHRSGSGSSSSSEDDGEGGRRKKKGVVEKIKEKLPGGDEQKTSATTTVGTGGGVGYQGEEGHEKKGLMEKIKEKLPGSHQ
ncbi:unnamed protein product [Lactuca saligna]|uniref:Dehydrin n=1 Tax=Lactuca saligna TaxID=75948 RepID=A0AA35W021_LACSI|nr:unnamed protein product [Lactuca saligna]